MSAPVPLDQGPPAGTAHRPASSATPGNATEPAGSSSASQTPRRRLAKERGWKRIVVSGGEQTDALVAALPPALSTMALRDPRVLVRLDLATLEEIITERVRAAHAEFEQRLIGTVRAQAHGAGAAALGLSEVVGALNQARVAHLVYDPFIRYRGSVGYDGSLYAEDETALTYGSTADQRLTERIVERALETGARVTPVEGAATDGLAEAPGNRRCSAVVGTATGSGASTPVPSRDFAHGAGARPPQRGPSSRPSRSERPHVRGSMTRPPGLPRALPTPLRGSVVNGDMEDGRGHPFGTAGG